MSFISKLIGKLVKGPTPFPDDNGRKIDAGFLKAVATMVNDRFVYERDTGDRWKMPSEMLQPDGFLYGDCEDYATACKAVLSAFGVPCRYVHCFTETGGSHMVLEVGGWVFDNRNPGITKRDALPYQWIAISEYGVLTKPRGWGKL